LFQCVINLLDNALKYGPAGQTVGLSLHCDADAVVIDITDEGPGVAQPDLAFNRMVRGDVTRQTAGHGLGLTLVRAIARLHGGDAVVVPGHRGARLRVSLPMH
jgi:signal transduction histidine kinase